MIENHRIRYRAPCNGIFQSAWTNENSQPRSRWAWQMENHYEETSPVRRILAKLT